MIILKATTETLQIVTTTAAAIDYSITFTDITPTSFTPSTSEGKITTATTTTSVVSAPAASTQREIKLITISNRDVSLSDTITVQKSISGTNYSITPSITLAAGETMQYMDGSGWLYYSASGTVKGSQTAAGSDTQIQFNSGGVLAGDPDLTWNSATNTLALSTNPQINLSGVTTAPSVPSAGTLALYAQPFAGKMQLMKLGWDGNPEAVQSALWQNNIVSFIPTVAAGVWQGTIGSNLGSNALALPTATNVYTGMRRSTFSTVVTTTNQQVGTRSENIFWRSSVADQGGFFFSCRFGFSAWTAGDRLFVGLSSGTTTVVTGDPSGQTNSIGFIIDAGDTAITFLHVDGTAANAVKEVISNQPALATNNAYDAYIYMQPNDSTVYYRLDNALTGTNLIEASVSTAIPIANTLLAAQAIMSNGANTAVTAASIGINRIYIETVR